MKRFWKSKLGQWICANFVGHDFYNCDRGGFVGSNMCDVWCNRCHKLTQMPRGETR